ncbi:MAG: hypothetical protein P1U63_06615 [Coxiellaceae bacterium]|nr:hypothetical protein [Coxiellaceae bacterium]
MTDQEITIAENQRFSECIFWRMQREYFDKQGINAWNKQVPFHATCNPFIANSYTSIALSFIKDWLKLHPSSIDHPFYIMELGTGSGLFSFYMLKAMHELREQLQMDDVKIVYVMTDFTSSNLSYWQQHPRFQYYLDSDLLDFAFFNMETKEDIHLLRSNKFLSKDVLVNPLLLCANYIFDSISSDAFTVKDGKVSESLLTLKTNSNNIVGGEVESWDEIDIGYCNKSIDLSSYYDDDIFNQVLHSYQGRLKNSHFLLPIASMRAIRKLVGDCDGNILLISSDKSYTHIDQIEGLNYPRMAFHGSFSLMVNYDAIAQYFKLLGGDAKLQPHSKAISTNVFLLGEQFDNLPHTKLAIEQRVVEFSPSDFLVLVKSKKKQVDELRLEELISLLKLSHWDPWIFHQYSVRINVLINKASLATRRYLTGNMAKIEANYYYMPSSINTLLEIGRFFQQIKQYSIALSYYAKSEALFGQQFDLISSKAFCTYHLGGCDDARQLFNEAAALVPKMSEMSV